MADPNEETPVTPAGLRAACEELRDHVVAWRRAREERASQWAEFLADHPELRGDDA